MGNIYDKRSIRSALFLMVIFAPLLGINNHASGQEIPAPSASRTAEVEEARRLSEEFEALVDQAKYDEALTKATRALEIRQRVFGPEHPDVAISLGDVALGFFWKKNYVKAREYYERALAMQEKLKLENHDVATTLNNYGLLYYTEGHTADAEKYYRRAVAMEERIPHGFERPKSTNLLLNLALVLFQKEDYAGAEQYFQRMLTLQERELGPEHPDIITTLNNLALTRQLLNKPAEAIQLLTRAVDIAHKNTDHPLPGALSALGDLLVLCLLQGDNKTADVVAQRGLVLIERHSGDNAYSTSKAYNAMGQWYKIKGDYTNAESYLVRALDLMEKSLLMNVPHASEVLTNLGALYTDKDEYDKAEEYLQRAKIKREFTYGTGHPNYATVLSHLGTLYLRQNEYVKAESMFEQALAIYRNSLGEQHPYSAAVINNLAVISFNRGDLQRTEEQFRLALKIRESTLPPGHYDIGISLLNVALSASANGKVAEAERLYRRATSLFEQSSGPQDVLLARALNDLGLLRFQQGDLSEAGALFRRAVAINENKFGAEHLELATNLGNLGLVYQRRGDFVGAERQFKRALDIFEKAGMQHHPKLATLLENLSELYDAKGDIANALSAAQRATEIEEYNLQFTLGTGSESQNRNRWLELYPTMMAIISLHAHDAPNNQQAARLALTTILRRKGRVLDAMTNSMQSLRDSPKQEDRDLYQKLVAVRSRIAALLSVNPYMTDDGRRPEQLKKLQDEYQRLEAMVSDRFRAPSQPITVEGLQRLIPADAALVEFVSYRPFNVRASKAERRWGPRRYVAYLLRGSGDVTWKDLGDGATIESAISALRTALRDPRRTDVRALARKVDEMVMRPVRKLLGMTRQVFISPDLSLQLVPFESLVDERGRYLIERYLFTYLTSGRDLQRLQSGAPSGQPPLVVANPDFNWREPAGEQPAKVVGDLQSAPAGMPSMTFTPLIGTEDEADGIAQVLSGAQVLLGPKATTASLKQVHGPRILHVATHGFFGDASSGATDSYGPVVSGPIGASLLLEFFPFNEDAQHYISSMSMSGIALAGANRPAGADGEDGLLTAFEISGLNLRGTKLVTLSACETGVGDVESSNGLYGLRRALVLAGAESQVISLWKVDDESTRDLMIDFYTRLRAGEKRNEALRQAKLSMMSSIEYSHPYYWSGFIQSGDWRAINFSPN